jgi:hypothetical protein
MLRIGKIHGIKEHQKIGNVELIDPRGKNNGQERIEKHN